MKTKYLIRFFIFLTLIFETKNVFTQQSIFSSGKWLKLGVIESGVYKLDRSFFESHEPYLDISEINPLSIQIYGSGISGSLSQNNNSKKFDSPVEMKIYFEGNDNEIFENSEYFLFYANNSNKVLYDSIAKDFIYSKNIYTDTSFYFLTFNQSDGKRISSRNSIGDFFYSTEYSNELFIYENDINNILQSGREWVGELFSNGDFKEFNVTSENVYDKNISVVLKTLSRSTDNSKFIISVNDKNIGELNLEIIEEDLYGEKVIFSADTFNVEIDDLEKINIKITYSGSSKSLAYLDHLIVDYKNKLFYNSGQKSFLNFNTRDYSKVEYNIETNENITIWDISDSYNIVEQLYDKDLNNARFSASSNNLSKFIMFNNNDYLIPVYHESAFSQDKQIRMSSILSHDNVELLIITHNMFISEANKLANFRRNHDQLVVKVVTVDEIYNQFSSSMPDVVAIRNYIKYLYDKTSKNLKYVLLFGDASYDYKNRISNNTNYVPTYQSRNSTNNIYSYSSDDFFGFLDENEGEWEENVLGDHTLDIGIGRIPVNNIEDSKKIVEKLIRYSTTSNVIGKWKNNIYLIADDGDYNIHQINAESHFHTINNSHPEFDIKKIYIDFFEQELVGGIEKTIEGNSKLNEAINQGSLILNYIGHGNEFLWAEERILDENTINNWKNRSKLPLLITATCEFGKFDDPLIVSGGELITIKGDGGAIALFTTTRPVFSQTNFRLNNEFYKHVFTKENGKFLRIGDIFRKTKNKSLSGPINRNFSLLGDPSLILNYPKYEIELIIPDSLSLDTLSALDKKSFEGRITNDNKTVDNFNGEVFINLFDKLSKKQTLGDESDPFYFEEWDKSIFRGSSTVKNGEFNFEFVVPKNINYNFGGGRISMYALDSLNKFDGNGSNQEFVVGGTAKEFSLDEIPPEIDIYFNDRTFTSGSSVGSNTLLIVDLFDENGINIIKSDFSNNLIARLDDSLDIILNDYFVSNKDDFKRGTIRYPLENLNIGKHKIEIKVYDTYNNLAEESVLFVVTNDLKLNIYNLMNYPNPFSKSTYFKFEHDREDEDLEVSFQIIDLYGKVLYNYYEIIENSSKLIEGIFWNGKDSNNQIISEGIYIYKLNVRSLFDGAYNTSYKKMVKRN